VVAPTLRDGAIVYERIDVLLLSQFEPAATVAQYYVPLTITQYVLFIPAVVGTAFLPLLAKHLVEDAPLAHESFQLMVRLFVLGGVPLALVLGIAAGDLLPFAFGERYRPSAEVLSALAVVAALGFQIYLFWYCLFAAHYERAMAIVAGIALVVNVALNLILIPAEGALGAALALGASDAVMLIGQILVVHRRVTRLSAGKLLGKPVAAGMIAAAAAALLWETSRMAAGLAAGGLFAATLLATRYVTSAELQPLTGPLRNLFGRRGSSAPA